MLKLVKNPCIVQVVVLPTANFALLVPTGVGQVDINCAQDSNKSNTDIPARRRRCTFLRPRGDEITWTMMYSELNMDKELVSFGNIARKVS